MFAVFRDMTVVPLQPHFEHVVLRTASSVILLPVWSLNFLRRLWSWLQPQTDNVTSLCTHVETQTCRYYKTTSTYSPLTLFGSKSCPVPWLTAFIEKDNFTLSPWIWEMGHKISVFLLTSLTQNGVCVCLLTSLPMTLIQIFSPISTISEAFSTLDADISLTCTRPVCAMQKKLFGWWIFHSKHCLYRPPVVETNSRYLVWHAGQGRLCWGKS